MCVSVRRVNSSRNDNDGLFRPCSRTSLALCVCVCVCGRRVVVGYSSGCLVGTICGLLLSLDGRSSSIW